MTETLGRSALQQPPRFGQLFGRLVLAGVVAGALAGVYSLLVTERAIAPALAARGDPCGRRGRRPRTHRGVVQPRHPTARRIPGHPHRRCDARGDLRGRLRTGPPPPARPHRLRSRRTARGRRVRHPRAAAGPEDPGQSAGRRRPGHGRHPDGDLRRRPAVRGHHGDAGVGAGQLPAQPGSGDGGHGYRRGGSDRRARGTDPHRWCPTTPTPSPRTYQRQSSGTSGSPLWASSPFSGPRWGWPAAGCSTVSPALPTATARPGGGSGCMPGRRTDGSRHPGRIRAGLVCDGSLPRTLVAGRTTPC